MKATSTKDPRFLRDARAMFERYSRVLVIVRYVFTAGNKDFILLDQFEQFKELIERLNEKDSVIVVKRFKIIKEGIVDKQFIGSTIPIFKSGEYWILIGPDNFKHTSDWAFADSVSELQEELDDRTGNEVCLIYEPNYVSESEGIDAYVPDSDGIVRPGAY